MIKHLLKLIWNRKRINFLIALEIFISFLVVFAVCVQVVYLLDNYRRPLGFAYANVWNVHIDMKQSSDDYFSPEQVETVRQLYLTLREFDVIESAAGAETELFSIGGNFGGVDINQRNIDFRFNAVTDDYAQVVGVQVARGRWFGKEDDGANYRPLVINQNLATARFGNEDPIGKRFNPTEERVEERVIGVVNEFRHGGEFAGAENMSFGRKNLNDPKQRPPRNLVLKLRPGTPRTFEEPLVKRLQAVAKDWSFEVQPLTDLRDTAITRRIGFVVTVGVIAVFLMLMVALGLTGVLWQSVTQRTKEIGLRRAKGATAQRIYRQILSELWLITTFGVVFGIAVVAQFPLLEFLGFLTARIYVFSLLLSLAVIYGLTTICGLYPSWLATKVQPAEALHYE